MSIDEDDLSKRVIECLDTLKKNNCLVDVREGLQTFLIYVSNVVKHPNELKYRKIRLSNVNYQVRLGHLKGGQDLLESIGYYPDDSNSFLILDSDKHTNKMDEKGLDPLKRIRDIVMKALERITDQFQHIERLEESPKHEWRSVRYACEAHDIGRRQSMEDDHLICDSFHSPLDKGKKSGATGSWGFFGVYDGHGGRATVDFLTCSFHLNLSHYLHTHPGCTMKKAFEDVYAVTDKQIQRQQIYQSGATAVTCVITDSSYFREDTSKIPPRVMARRMGLGVGISGKPPPKCPGGSTGRTIYLANVGDARAVLSRNGKALRLTKDHKASDADEVRMIKKRGGFINRVGRVNGLLAVSRAFGDHLLKPPVSVMPHCSQIEIGRDDNFVIIACDGLFDVLSDAEVVQYIQHKVKSRLNVSKWDEIYSKKNYKEIVSETLKALVHAAITKYKSLDNVSAILLCL